MKILKIVGATLAVVAGIMWLLTAAFVVPNYGGIASDRPNEAFFMASFFGCFAILGVMVFGFSCIGQRLDELEERIDKRDRKRGD